MTASDAALTGVWVVRAVRNGIRNVWESPVTRGFGAFQALILKIRIKNARESRDDRNVAIFMVISNARPAD